MTCRVEAVKQSPAPTGRPSAAAYRNLVVATIGFGLTFWAWNLIAPLSGDYKERLGLSSFEQSLLVAVPVLVGSLGRIAAGAFTDKYGARLMFPLVSALTIIPVLLLIPARNSYGAMLAVGFLLGLGGTTFAIGIPLVNSWFPPSDRGLALGVFGMGMGGVALSGYFTPRIAQHGHNLPFLVVAGALVVYAALAMVLISDHPDRKVPTDSLGHRLGDAGRLRVTWELSALYAIGFGGIVAFGVYLPTYLKTWYGLSPTDAGTKAAGFALVTVVFRPIGGWLSDHIHPALVTSAALGLAALMAIVQAFDPKLAPGGTIALLCMAAGLGTSSGSIFALVSQVTPQPKVGSVTGIVGAMGGLGGFVPPLVMGAIYSAKGSYSIGFMLLSDLALAGCVYAYGRMRNIQRDRRTPEPAV
ncbi:NarK/NasA family nitrate transporter [Streptomyces sp. NBC_01744]|nr:MULTISPECIES: NarK/NasA family nitrate transporter [unclassified Streptomyces]WSF86892.1 NarK/NasA family nitrate transporter [Streptomyces sp. NBC_01744]WSC36838.1 NarK/NasA family nitrate transporter [Streptomyces sp. NBC_01763]WSC44931.1 NarK/NasA family nitrate transporter [Streptomyces sp. NBC_01762]WSC56062.1 NarK/NasA family nitrate transporter [Streptomyces sp. NBC_01761]WSD24591.1 NarK/NasA family nitrate transporter [Streptomyces sp. NBC_01751]